MKRSMLLAVLVLILSSSSFAAIFVKWDSANNGPGNDWDHAYHSVQMGLNASASGDEVWVAGDAAHPYYERIAIYGGVGLYGGFAGTESSRDERDPAANVTILDGQALGSVVSTLQPTPSGFTAVIDGFTIRNGNAYFGGGIYCSGGSPTISNNIISGNVATENYGGGIYCLDSSPIITNNSITGNLVQTRGTHPYPSTSHGGGIYCSGGSPQVTFNSFKYNKADMGNYIYGANGNGGAIYLTGVDVSSRVTNNVIVANSAAHGIGCGIYVSACSPAITGNTIVHNGGGEAIYCVNSSSPISNNIVASNTSGILGSGTFTPTLRNNCIYNPDGKNYSGLSAGTGDISVDPKLIAPEFGEIHLQAGSPCIGAGWNDAPGLTSLDMDGDARILPAGEVTDIGADEYNGVQPPFTRNIIRVSHSGDDTDGSTWAHAKQTVAGGLALAATQGGEVWVAAGTYSERVSLGRYVYLYGGFAGTESQRSERDWETNVTVLDGGGGGSVVTAQSITGYRNCCVDGFTIRNGTGTRFSPGLFGGGIYVYRACPSIAHNVITGNTADWGGGIGLVAGCVYISDNTIVENSAQLGGGIVGSTMSDSTICRNLITGNTASEGGGIFHFGNGSYTIADNVIRQNTARSGGGLKTMYGISTDYHNVFNNLFYANMATGYGGGVYSNASSFLACNNTFYGNSAAHYPPLGGAVFTGAGTWCNNILAFNTSGVYRLRSPLVWRNNDVFGSTDIWYGKPADYVSMPTNPTGTNGNISVNPQFLAPVEDNFRLSVSSPCIDTGSDSDAPAWPDLDGKTRIFGSHVDMGCFEWRPVIEATVDIKPDTLNPKSKGQYITAYIELPAGEWDLEDIDVSSLKLNGPIEPAACPPETGDYDADAIPDLMVKFSREALCGLLGAGEQTITLTGMLSDGTTLTGEDTVRVLAK